LKRGYGMEEEGRQKTKAQVWADDLKYFGMVFLEAAKALEENEMLKSKMPLEPRQQERRIEERPRMPF